MKLFMLAVASLLALSTIAYAAEDHPPDVITATDVELACTPRPRPESQLAAWKRRAMVYLNAQRARAGLPRSSSRDFEYDHRIPRCMGGVDHPSNLWLQRCYEWAGPECVAGPARDKDELERSLCHDVCNARTVPLAIGQQTMREWKDRE